MCTLTSRELITSCLRCTNVLSCSRELRVLVLPRSWASISCVYPWFSDILNNGQEIKWVCSTLCCRLCYCVMVGFIAQLVRMSIYDRHTFPALCRDVQLINDLFGVNHPLYLSQRRQFSLASSWGRQMSSKSNTGVRCAYMRSGVAWRMLTSEGRYGVICR